MERLMFDMATLKDIKKKADELSYFCLSGTEELDAVKVTQALDQVSRALSMFAEVELHLMNGRSIPFDPESYIRGRLGLAHRSLLSVSTTHTA
ncbi:hypothetical protein Q0N12_20070 [Rossellomorea marisflavi]|uniref:hypothetical protein n=1 Tax=Rossellomorea marisflavi TaxID=189381 RepID=UPI00345B46B6